MATLRQLAQGLDPGKYIELWEADFTTIDPAGDVLYWHNYNTQGAASLFFMGHEFVPFPIRAEQFEYKGTGTLPRPHLFVSNVLSDISALCKQYNDCVGVKITRRQTFYEFLDDQPGHDTTQQYPPDIFNIERKVNESNLEVEFEMASNIDFENIQLPRRQIISSLCKWVFRGPDCGYTGAPKTDMKGTVLVATTDRGAYNAATSYASGDYTYTLVGGIRVYWVSLASANTAPLTDTTKWTRSGCNKRLTTGCKAHFGANNPLPFGGFPGTARLPST